MSNWGPPGSGAVPHSSRSNEPKVPMRLLSPGTAPLPTHPPRGWARTAASSSWSTYQTCSPCQATAGAGEEAKVLAPVAKLYWFLDSIAGGFCLEPVLGAPRVGEGQGWGSHGCTGCCACGETSTTDQGCSFPTGNGCREVCSGQTLAPCQPCSCLNVWEYLLGNPRGKRSWPWGKGRPQCQSCV